MGILHNRGSAYDLSTYLMSVCVYTYLHMYACERKKWNTTLGLEISWWKFKRCYRKDIMFNKGILCSL